ncbi:phosphoserine phosphatase [Martiniozyma asiatica (nom. inval.)]|nr:phosphoserine phosphatase [Martiniozyma asiatica]
MSYTITAIAHSKFSSSTVNDISNVLASLPVKLISFTYLSPDKAVDFHVDIDLTLVDFSDSEGPDECDLIDTVISLRQSLKNAVPNVDLILQETATRKDRALIVFDMDSTLICQEVIELIAEKAGVEAKVEEITTRAMNGELDFKESLKERVALLKGIDATSLWEDLKPKLVFTKGAKELCDFMKSKNCRLAVCSGGFLPLAEYVKEQLGLHYAFANNLETEEVDGKLVLSGRTLGGIVDGQKKKDILIRLAHERNASFSQCVAVGDGANDLLMMKQAGFGVAWNAKPKVQNQAPACLNSDSLRDILYMFGYSDADFL